MKGYTLLVNRFDIGYAKYMRVHPVGGIVVTFFGFPMLTLAFMGIFMFVVASLISFLGNLLTIMQ